MIAANRLRELKLIVRMVSNFLIQWADTAGTTGRRNAVLPRHSNQVPAFDEASKNERIISCIHIKVARLGLTVRIEVRKVQPMHADVAYFSLTRFDICG